VRTMSSVEAGFMASKWTIGIFIAWRRRFWSLGADVTERPAPGVPTATNDGLELPESIPNSPRFCFFAASHLLFGSGITSSVMVADLAFFSCWYEAMLFCKAARAASAPAVSGRLVCARATLARCVTTASKSRSLVEVEVYNSFRKVSGEIVRSKDRFP
jgi:hypothetical protein